MGVYADILTREQGTAPERMHVVLGDGTVATVGVSSIIHYFRVAQERFLEYVGAPPAESAGAPCGHCTFCRWAPFCAAEWEATSHLSIVRSEEHTSELQSLMRISYAVFCLKKK